MIASTNNNCTTNATSTTFITISTTTIKVIVIGNQSPGFLYNLQLCQVQIQKQYQLIDFILVP